MGNYWSTNQLLDIRNNFLVSPTISSFRSTEDRLTWCEKWKLGYTHKIWKTACLYKFMINEQTNLTSDKLICDFRDMEYETMQAFKKHEDWAVYPMLILWKVMENEKYEKIIKNINDIDYKAKVDLTLHNSIL